MSEVVFDVTKETTGGYDAESTTETLSAQGDTWEDLCANVRKIVEHYFQDGPKAPVFPSACITHAGKKFYR